MTRRRSRGNKKNHSNHNKRNSSENNRKNESAQGDELLASDNETNAQKGNVKVTKNEAGASTSNSNNLEEKKEKSNGEEHGKVSSNGAAASTSNANNIVNPNHKNENLNSEENGKATKNNAASTNRNDKNVLNSQQKKQRINEKSNVNPTNNNAAASKTSDNNASNSKRKKDKSTGDENGKATRHDAGASTSQANNASNSKQTKEKTNGEENGKATRHNVGASTSQANNASHSKQKKDESNGQENGKATRHDAGASTSQVDNASNSKQTKQKTNGEENGKVSRHEAASSTTHSNNASNSKQKKDKSTGEENGKENGKSTRHDAGASTSQADNSSNSKQKKDKSTGDEKGKATRHNVGASTSQANNASNTKHKKDKSTGEENGKENGKATRHDAGASTNQADNASNSKQKKEKSNGEENGRVPKHDAVASTSGTSNVLSPEQRKEKTNGEDNTRKDRKLPDPSNCPQYRNGKSNIAVSNKVVTASTSAGTKKDENCIRNSQAGSSSNIAIPNRRTSGTNQVATDPRGSTHSIQPANTGAIPKARRKPKTEDSTDEQELSSDLRVPLIEIVPLSRNNEIEITSSKKCRRKPCRSRRYLRLDTNLSAPTDTISSSDANTAPNRNLNIIKIKIVPSTSTQGTFEINNRVANSHASNVNRCYQKIKISTDINGQAAISKRLREMFAGSTVIDSSAQPLIPNTNSEFQAILTNIQTDLVASSRIEESNSVSTSTSDIGIMVYLDIDNHPAIENYPMLENYPMIENYPVIENIEELGVITPPPTFADVDDSEISAGEGFRNFFKLKIEQEYHNDYREYQTIRPLSCRIHNVDANLPTPECTSKISRLSLARVLARLIENETPTDEVSTNTPEVNISQNVVGISGDRRKSRKSKRSQLERKRKEKTSFDTIRSSSNLPSNMGQNSLRLGTVSRGGLDSSVTSTSRWLLLSQKVRVSRGTAISNINSLNTSPTKVVTRDNDIPSTTSHSTSTLSRSEPLPSTSSTGTSSTNDNLRRQRLNSYDQPSTSRSSFPQEEYDEDEDYFLSSLNEQSNMEFISESCSDEARPSSRVSDVFETTRSVEKYSPVENTSQNYQQSSGYRTMWIYRPSDVNYYEEANNIISIDYRELDEEGNDDYIGDWDILPDLFDGEEHIDPEILLDRGLFVYKFDVMEFNWVEINNYLLNNNHHVLHYTVLSIMRLEPTAEECPKLMKELVLKTKSCLEYLSVKMILSIRWENILLRLCLSKLHEDTINSMRGRGINRTRLLINFLIERSRRLTERNLSAIIFKATCKLYGFHFQKK